MLELKAINYSMSFDYGSKIQGTVVNIFEYLDEDE